VPLSTTGAANPKEEVTGVAKEQEPLRYLCAGESH
jgi:hypothetical protein